MVTTVVDSRGTACPGPITDLIRAYRKSKNGDIIELIATDPGVRADAKSWCDRTRNELVDIQENAGEYRVRIKITGKAV
ncbi:MAG: sulfurtransferase TusA family protein [Thermoplasmataceae archaeon]